MKSRKFFYLIAVIFLTLSLWGGLACDAKQPASEEDAFTFDPIEAYVMAQEFVKDRLKSPSTADFPWFGTPDVSVNHVVVENIIRIKVKSYVDSQNSFGAMVRTHYWAIIEYNMINKGYSLKNIIFK